MTEISLILFDLNGVLYRYDRDARIAYLASHRKTVSGRSFGRDLAFGVRGLRRCGRAGCGQLSAWFRGVYRLRFVGNRVGGGAACRRYADRCDAGAAAAHPFGGEVRRADQQQSVGAAAFFGAVSRGCRAGGRSGVCFGRVRFAEAGSSGLSRLLKFGWALPPETALFVDDSPSNVAGAREAGLLGHDYTQPDLLVAALDARGLLA
jgi:hypothetical protein